MKHDWQITPIPGMTVKTYTCRSCKTSVIGVNRDEVDDYFWECRKGSQPLIVYTDKSIQLPCCIVTSAHIAESFQRLKFPVYTFCEDSDGESLHFGIKWKNVKHFIVLPKHQIDEQDFFIDEE